MRATNVADDGHGVGFTAVGPSFRIDISTRLPGAFNVFNCLAALGATTLGLGIAPGEAAKGIASLQGVPGRMERIDVGQSFVAIVDFAHTPNALKVAVEAAQAVRLAEGGRHVIAVFGSAGLRDKEKRRLMAETAAELADLTVFTAEDPRSESLASILDDMAAGARSRGGREGQTFWRVPDRGAAIKLALRLAQPHDVVIACGKGHEQSMCFGRIEYPWDDRLAMRAALAELLGIAGPAMPYLPTQDRQEVEWLS